jgi:hypothetical protein
MCYVTRESNWWWWKSSINCCAPFFQQWTNDQVFDNNIGQSDNLDLNYMVSSGSLLLHEMMHSFEITGSRRHCKFCISRRPLLQSSYVDSGG